MTSASARRSYTRTQCKPHPWTHAFCPQESQVGAEIKLRSFIAIEFTFGKLRTPVLDHVDNDCEEPKESPEDKRVKAQVRWVRSWASHTAACSTTRECFPNSQGNAVVILFAKWPTALPVRVFGGGDETSVYSVLGAP
jgi:hypothetical protein